MGNVFDAVAEVILGECGVSPVSLVSCTDSSASVVMCFNVWFAFEGAKGDVGEAVTVVLDGMLVITLGSCLVFGVVGNVALIFLRSMSLFSARSLCRCSGFYISVGWCNSALKNLCNLNVCVHYRRAEGKC